MMQYRKKPVVINAWPIDRLLFDAASRWALLPDPVREFYEQGNMVFAADSLSIQTPEGIMIGMPDDMLIQGVKGEFYPCKPDIFAATYEAVGE